MWLNGQLKTISNLFQIGVVYLICLLQCLTLLRLILSTIYNLKGKKSVKDSNLPKKRREKIPGKCQPFYTQVTQVFLPHLLAPALAAASTISPLPPPLLLPTIRCNWRLFLVYLTSPSSSPNKLDFSNHKQCAPFYCEKKREKERRKKKESLANIPYTKKKAKRWHRQRPKAENKR